MRTEPDYRLFTIHMLLHLRKLGMQTEHFHWFISEYLHMLVMLLADDRSVMDSERRAALMHFDSDQVCIPMI